MQKVVLRRDVQFNEHDDMDLIKAEEIGDAEVEFSVVRNNLQPKKKSLLNKDTLVSTGKVDCIHVQPPAISGREKTITVRWFSKV